MGRLTAVAGEARLRRPYTGVDPSNLKQAILAEGNYLKLLLLLPSLARWISDKSRQYKESILARFYLISHTLLTRKAGGKRTIS